MSVIHVHVFYSISMLCG